MADEKLNTSPEENPQPSLFDTGPAEAPTPEAPTPEPPAPEKAPEQAAGEPPAQDAPAGAPGEVNVSADQIEKLMAERRAAERAEVEKNEPPEPEQPPTPAPEEKAPAKKGKAAEEKTPTPEDKPPSPPRDKMSQSKGTKAATVKGKEEAPAAPQPAPEAPPQPRDATRAEKEEIVYLNLSELFPFKDHPFGVRDDAEMKGLVESVKDNGVHQPALVRPREGGGYEIIAGHRRQRASELAGFANMPCIVRNMTDDEAMNELLGGEKLPKMDALKKQRRELADKKKALYAEYRQAQRDMREAVAVKANIDHLLGLTDGRTDKEQTR